jgi:hypothetical protein
METCMLRQKQVSGTRWVDVNKGDKSNPLYRSRLVAQELERGDGDDEFHPEQAPSATSSRFAGTGSKSR